MSELSYLERQIAKSREMCDFLETHLAVFTGNQPYLSGTGASNYYYDDLDSEPKVIAKDEMVKVMRALRKDKRIVKTEKEYQGASFLIRLTLTSGAILALQADRESVCTKKVVGTETVETRDYDAAPMKTITRDVVEWECSPILDAVT